jgi:hypothetical protein
MSIDFVSQAPCKDADPWLFDQNIIDLALPGLRYCQGCPFWQECDTLIEPRKSFYDGVAAGKIWKNGKVLARLDSASPHRLILREDPEYDVDAMAVRGSELLGD